MLNCKQASQLISQSLDRRLSLSNRLQLRFHLILCDACTRFKRQISRLRFAVTTMKQQAENDQAIQLSAEAKARIVRQINNETASKSH